MFVLAICLGVVFSILFCIACKIKEDWRRGSLRERKKWFQLFLHSTCELWFVLMCICGMAILLIGMIAGMEYRPKVAEKIEIYEQENKEIEEQIAILVEDYMEFELGIIKECKPEDATTLVTLYPTLSSSTLVSRQMEIYLQNKQEIKDLKSQELTQSIVRWWFYFGD